MYFLFKCTVAVLLRNLPRPLVSFLVWPSSATPVGSLETRQNEPRRTMHLLLALYFRGSRPRCCATLDIKMLSFNGQNHVRTVHMVGAIPITASVP